MSNGRTPEYRPFELEMIKADATFYRQFVDIIRHNSSSMATLMFGSMPYWSLFVMETYNYFRRNFPEFAREIILKHEGIIRASRMRTKLFDDKKKDIPELIEHWRWIVEFLHSWMNSEHVGKYAWRKWFQDDLGLYLYNDHVISTNQIAMFNIGFEKGDIPLSEQGKPIGLSERSKSIGQDIGKYTGTLFSSPSSPLFCYDLGEVNAEIFRYRLLDDAFDEEDKKAYAYLQSVFNGKDTPYINAYLTLFLATVNFLLHVFSQLVVNVPVTWFKIKFLALHHIASSMTKLRDYCHSKGCLSELSKKYLQQLLDDRELEAISSKPGRDFRNILVHYGIREIPEEKLQPDLRYFGLIEYFFVGSSFDNLNNKVDRQLVRIAEILERWMHQKDY